MPALLGALLLGLLLACGKYGPPVRASEEKQPEPEPRIEIPLPAVSDEQAPESSAPPPPAEPPIEEEPPLEGAP